MGRQQDLERLVLGRSAFQDAQTLGDTPDDRTHDTDTSSVGEHTYKQRYDDKGRPINQATETRNQSMRNAQNAVLALVGVVESKENSDREKAKHCNQAMEAREDLLESEQECGELLDMITTIVHLAVTWWPYALVSRVQAGLYAKSDSFINILLKDLKAFRFHGMKGFLETFFAGLPACFLHRSLEMLVCGSIQASIGRLQAWLDRRRFHQRTSRSVNRTLVFAFEALVVAVDVALLPIQYYAMAQMLGLVAARPLLPNWQLISPWDKDSAHSFIWKPTGHTSWLGRLCSPAVLILLQNYLKLIYGRAIPYANHQARVRSPRIKSSVLNTPHPDVRHGSFSKLLYNGYVVRERVLEWFGWNLAYLNKFPRPAVMHRHHEGNDQSPAIHRSTSLACLPAQYLAERVDDSLSRLLMLPWKSTVLRVITQSVLTSTLTRTPLAISSAADAYSPFGGGPLSVLRTLGFSAAAWHKIASYANKLGLSLALNSSTEIGVFFVVYQLTRWQGVRNFRWSGMQANISGSDQHV